MEVRGRFAPHALLRPHPYAFSRSLDPHSVEVVELTLESSAAIRPPHTAILPLDVTITYRPEALRKPLVWERTIFAVVDRPISVPRTKANRPVMLDGKLDEWPGLPLSADRPAQLTGAASVWAGPEDTSFRFGLLQDDEWLYLAVDVRDDVWTARSESNLRLQDHSGLLLDARPMPERSDQVANSGASIFSLALIPRKPRGRGTILSRKLKARGAQLFSDTTATGYTLECAIPHRLLDQIQGRPWYSFRLNLFAVDMDGLTSSRVLVWWRPGWNTMESYPGSGTFVRE